MLRKINKQREKIERLAAKENDAAEKLTQLRQELADERDALDEMEKEYLFSLMREKELSLEETIVIFESSASDHCEALDTDDAAGTDEEPEDSRTGEDAADLTESAEGSVEERQEQVPEDRGTEGSFFSGFRRREMTDEGSFRQQ